MFWKLVSLVILGALPAIHSEASQSFTVPPPSLVERLRQQHHRSDWLRITTDSVPFDARVREIGAQSLDGLSPRRRSTVVPETIPWSAVARLDQLRSSSRVGQVLGFAAGGILGLAVGGGGTTEGGIGFALGAACGTWLGGTLGGMRVRERTLYVATPAPDSVSPVGETAAGAADSSGAKQAEPVVSAASATSWKDSIGIERAVSRLRPNQFLRISGELGKFEGFVDHAGPDGLEGLRPSRPEDLGTPWLRELEWDRIERIDRRGNSAGRGALTGGVIFAGLGLIFGTAAAAGYSLGSAQTGDIVGAAAAGALIGGALGAGLGALIGCGIPRWHLVYKRS